MNFCCLMESVPRLCFERLQLLVPTKCADMSTVSWATNATRPRKFAGLLRSESSNASNFFVFITPILSLPAKAAAVRVAVAASIAHLAVVMITLCSGRGFVFNISIKDVASFTSGPQVCQLHPTLCHQTCKRLFSTQNKQQFLATRTYIVKPKVSVILILLPYGQSMRPMKERMATIDFICFTAQLLGCEIYTMHLWLCAAASAF